MSPSGKRATERIRRGDRRLRRSSKQDAAVASAPVVKVSGGNEDRLVSHIQRRERHGWPGSNDPCSSPLQVYMGRPNVVADHLGWWISAHRALRLGPNPLPCHVLVFGAGDSSRSHRFFRLARPSLEWFNSRGGGMHGATDRPRRAPLHLSRICCVLLQLGSTVPDALRLGACSWAALPHRAEAAPQARPLRPLRLLPQGRAGAPRRRRLPRHRRAAGGRRAGRELLRDARAEPEPIFCLTTASGMVY